ncbi:MAG: hypothetical protein U0169_08480 [Polyangiaceae bacterium]
MRGETTLLRARLWARVSPWIAGVFVLVASIAAALALVTTVAHMPPPSRGGAEIPVATLFVTTATFFSTLAVLAWAVRLRSLDVRRVLTCDADHLVVASEEEPTRPVERIPWDEVASIVHHELRPRMRRGTLPTARAALEIVGTKGRSRTFVLVDRDPGLPKALLAERDRARKTLRGGSSPPKVPRTVEPRRNVRPLETPSWRVLADTLAPDVRDARAWLGSLRAYFETHGDGYRVPKLPVSTLEAIATDPAAPLRVRVGAVATLARVERRVPLAPDDPHAERLRKVAECRSEDEIVEVLSDALERRTGRRRS